MKTLSIALLLGCLCATGFADEPRKTPFLSGADVSLLAKLEAAGVVFKDAGKPGDVLAMLRDRGANCIRLRLFVNPDGKNSIVNDLPYTIALARRVKAQGMQLLLVLHYSDSWADPGHQETPAAWKGLPFARLVEKVERYTTEVVTALNRAEAAPDLVQVGNEITNGMLWPAARFDDQSGSQDEVFDRLAVLLKAGIRGVHRASGKGRPVRIVLHVSRGADRGLPKWFFDHITARDVPFDVIGLSYYPFMGDTLAGLRDNLISSAETYRKPVLVAETAYPWVDTDHWRKQPGVTHPPTPAGQKAFMEELIGVSKAVPHGRGMGVLYWCPEFVPAKDNSITGWWNGELSLFDRGGNALPGLDALGRNRGRHSSR